MWQLKGWKDTCRILPSGFISKACSRKKLFSSADSISASFAPSRLQKDWVKEINELDYEEKKEH